MYKSVVVFIALCFWMGASFGFYQLFGFEAVCWLLLSVIAWQGAIKNSFQENKNEKTDSEKSIVGKK